jgi:hypothetical protein
MAMFVHLAPEKAAKSIERVGIRLPRARKGGTRGVYALPVTRNFYISHQWLRELKRQGQRTFVAVHFRIPDRQVVMLGHYNREHIAVTAAQAPAIVMREPNAEGYQVILPRAVAPREIHAIRNVPQIVGWRYYPGSHGKKPCGCPVCQPRGEIKSRRLREKYEAEFASDDEEDDA